MAEQVFSREGNICGSNRGHSRGPSPWHVPKVVSGTWAGGVFRRFREARPNVELRIQPATTIKQLDAIRSGMLDAGFLNDSPKEDELEHIFLQDLRSLREVKVRRKD